MLDYVDDATFEQLISDLNLAAADWELSARLARVESHLRKWREGDLLEGAMAADALDQLLGHLEDPPIEPRLAPLVEAVLVELPPSFQ